MRNKRLLWVSAATIVLLACSLQGYAQVQAVPNRIPQEILVNGQRANAVLVQAPEGGLQKFSCPNPVQYATPDGSSQGWACYEQSSGLWLLNSVPPAPQPVAVQQPVVVQQAPTIVQQQPAVVVQQPVQVVYTSPAVVYEPSSVVYVSSRPVVVRPVYRPSVVIGAAVIHATGRIVAAAVGGNHRYSYNYGYGNYRTPIRIGRRR